jgi:hypothetical protein
MANYQATIDLIVRGQRQIDRVLSSIDQLSSLVDKVKATPIQFNTKGVATASVAAQKAIDGLIKKQAIYQTQLKRNEEQQTDLLLKRATLELKLQNKRRNPDSKAYKADQEALKRNIDLAKRLGEEYERLSSGVTSTFKEIGRAQKRAAAIPALEEEIRFVNQLADQYLKLGASRKIGVQGQFLKGLASNLPQASLKQQVQLFSEIASNSETASKSFRKFTISSELASQKLAATSRKTFQVLAEAFSAEAPKTSFGSFLGKEDLAGARKQVDEVIAAYPGIAKSIAGLGAYRGELSNILSLLPIASSEWTRVASAIKLVDDQLDRVALNQNKKDFGPEEAPRMGPAKSIVFGPERSAEELKFNRLVNAELEKQTAIEERIKNANLTKTQQKDLLLRLDEANTALVKGRLDTAHSITRELDEQRKSYERLNRRAAQDPAQQTEDRRQRVFAKAQGIERSLLTLGASGIAVEQELVNIQTAKNKLKELEGNITQSNAEASTAQVRELLGDVNKVSNALGEMRTKVAGAGGLGKTRTFGVLGTDFLPITGKLPGGSLVAGSPKAKEKEIETVEKVNKLLEEQDALQKKINESSLTSSQKQELTNKTLAARGEIEGRNFDAARKISDQVKESTSSYQKLNKDTERVNNLYKKAIEYTQEWDSYLERLENKELFDSSDIDDFTSKLTGSFGELENLYKELNQQGLEAGRDFDNRLKASGPFKDRLLDLKKLNNDYTIESKKGVQAETARARVLELIKKLESNSVEASKENLNIISAEVSTLKKQLSVAISEARAAGTYATGGASAASRGLTVEAIEGRRNALLSRSYTLEGQLISLQGKGVDVAEERAAVQTRINNLKQLEGQITEKNIEDTARDLRAVLRATQEAENAAKQSRNVLAERGRATGFSKSFEGLRESLAGSGAFFGEVSPQEAIDKVVREFTPSLLGTPGLVTLSQLEKPAKLSSERLKALSTVLQEIYSQLDPVGPAAQRLAKELIQTIPALDNIQASRAPDADFLDRITKNPRLSAGISEGLIGGAFPLLFGQGLGASVGGGVGGFAGGAAGGALGFGLSLIGTAAGSALDALAVAAQDTGKALMYPVESFQQLKDAGLFAGRSQEFLISKLIESGKTAEASAVIQGEIIKKIGVQGSKDLTRLGDSSIELSKAWGELNLQMQAVLAGPLTGLIRWATSSVKSVSGEIQAAENIKNIRQGLPESQRKELDRRMNEAYAKSSFSGDLASSGGVARLIKEYDAIAKEFSSRSTVTPPQAALTPEEKQAAQLKPYQEQVDKINRELESIDITKKYTDAIRAAANEQQDLDRQRSELIKSYEESIADIRLGVERRIVQERLSNLQKENELFAAQGNLRLQQLQNANAELKNSLAGNDFGQQFADVVTEFTEKQLSTENEIANRRRSLEAEIEGKKVEVEQYRADVAQQVARLNTSTQKQIEQIELSVLRKKQEYDAKRFNLEKNIAINNLEIKRLEAKQQEELYRNIAKANPFSAQEALGRASVFEKQAEFIEQQKNLVKGFAPPPQLSFAPLAVGASVSTAGIQSVSNKGIQLARDIKAVEDQISQLIQGGNIDELNAKLKALADQGANAAIDKFEDLRGALVGNPLERSNREIDNAIEKISKAAGAASYKELFKLYGDLAKANLKLVASLEYFNEAVEEQISRIESLKAEINSAIVGTSEYEKTLIDLTQRGIKPTSEEFQTLIDGAKKIDILQEKLEVINRFKTFSDSLTSSLRGLIENFYELGSASEAVKRVGQELGQKSLGLILDIAFKPVEQAMQKSIFDIAGKLGFDIKPESLQQLEEIKIIRTNIEQINTKIGQAPGGTGLIGGLAQIPESAMQDKWTEAAVRHANMAELFLQQAEQEFKSGVANPDTRLYGLARKKLIDVVTDPGSPPLDAYPEALGEMMKDQVRRFEALERMVNGQPYANPTTTNPTQPQATPIQRIPYSQQFDTRSSLPTSAFTGMGGSNDQVPGGRQVFPLPDSAPELEVEKFTNSVNEVQTQTDKLTGYTYSAAEGIWQFGEETNLFNEYFKRKTLDFSTASGQWQLNLGQAVTALGLASSAVVGIVGGVQQVKQGGIGNVLGGIGSILTTVGSIGLSVAGMMKPGLPSGGTGGFSAPPAGFNVFGNSSVAPGYQFAMGGIVKSPTLFEFEEGGIQKTGLTGEAGPEAIMPLRRGADGRLGVEADLSVPFESLDALGDDQEGDDEAVAARTLSVPFRKEGGAMSAARMMQIAEEAGLSIPFAKSEGLAATGSSGDSGVIRFESVIINNQEFVTRDEAEEIGRKAEIRGANRGADLANRRIKNNNQLRKSLGIPS